MILEEGDASETEEDANEVGDRGGDTLRAEMPLAERMAVLEREWREMQIEWLSMYDQFRSLYGRISRRMQRETQNGAKKADEAPINPAAAHLLGRRP